MRQNRAGLPTVLPTDYFDLFIMLSFSDQATLAQLPRMWNAETKSRLQQARANSQIYSKFVRMFKFVGNAQM
jgi:hypothetical protein